MTPVRETPAPPSEVYAGLTKRLVDNARPLYVRNTLPRARAIAYAKTVGAVAIASTAIAGTTDGVIELTRTHPAVASALDWIGQGPVDIAAIGVVAAGVVGGTVAVMSALDDVDADERASVVTGIHRVKVGSVYIGAATAVLGGLGELWGSTGAPGMTGTGHVLLDASLSLGALGAIAHVTGRALRTGLPKPHKPTRQVSLVE